MTADNWLWVFIIIIIVQIISHCHAEINKETSHLSGFKFTCKIDFFSDFLMFKFKFKLYCWKINKLVYSQSLFCQRT